MTGNQDAIADDQGRRRALKQLGVGAAGAAVVWSAPSILSVSSAAAASGASGGGCAGCGNENIVNGSFEDPQVGGAGGAAASWSGSFPSAVTYQSMQQQFAPPFSPTSPGNQTGVSSDPINGLSQTFSVHPSCIGKGYTFSFWAWSLVSASTATLSFVGANVPDVSIQIPGQAPPPPPLLYAQYFAPVATIPAGTTAVTVTFSTTAGIGVDLVSFIIGC